MKEIDSTIVADDEQVEVIVLKKKDSCLSDREAIYRAIVLLKQEA